ncbi:MAG: glycosyltransferase family 2 protein [bacterium]|nr:glycosyltransferase family 2 protein [bacterium]
MKKIIVVVPSYKNSKWYERNLSSIIAQNYNNFKTIYVDDCSPDNTGELVEKYIAKHNQQNNISLIRNTERKGAMYNLYTMIHSCDDNDIIVTLDGDDHLAHSNVLSRVAKEYDNPNIWLTWGQYKDSNGGVGCSKAIPENIVTASSFRNYRWCSSHLRTFYAGLFKKIKKEDFLDSKGNFYAMAWDLAMYFPMLEMAGNRGRFIPDILYVYNTQNELNDSKVNLQLQQGTERIIRSKPRYTKIGSL